jgi:peptidoglycan hydrolase-like protein with peptidoglycan-binding domain
MSRGRIALAVLAGVLVGFFLAVGALALRPSSTPALTSSATASSQSATAQATAAFGAAQAATHKAGITKPQIVPFIRTLKLGDHGDGTKQLQQALVRAKLRPAKAKATGYYGPITARQVLAFQRKVKLTPSGVFGHPTLLKLSRFYTAAMRGQLSAIARAHAVARWQAGILRGRAAYARAAIAGRAHYSQSIARSFFPRMPRNPATLLASSSLDCSSYVTWLYSISGAPTSGFAGRLPDPNGFGYRVIGYTGTLAKHGVRVSANAALRVGDLVFYGGGYPYGHVAIVVDAVRRLVSSHGQPGVRTVPFNYRAVSAIRRYF